MSQPSRKPRLHILIGSTRPGRVGPVFARWFHQFAQEHGAFDAVLVDLADFHLPVFDEPHLPVLQNYQNDHTRRWAASVQAADAFVFVTPEYNYNPPPALLNALQYLNHPWNYKPASFVSYGFLSGGLRAVQTLKLLLTTLKMVPLNEQVAIPMYPQSLDAEGEFTPNAFHLQSARESLDELARWTQALSSLRDTPYENVVKLTDATQTESADEEKGPALRALAG